MARVFVVGLDGATFDLIDPWIGKGELPNLKKIIDGSSYGKLESTIPPISPPAWASFMTGVNPGRHGIFDFITFKPNSFEKVLINSSHIRSRRFWDLAGEKGRKSIILYIPLTYPPQRTEGVMISGIPVPPKGEFIYPREMEAELQENIGTWWMEIDGDRFRDPDEKALLNDVYQSLEIRFKVADYLMEKDWDLFVLVITETDVLQHLLWQERDRFLLPLYKKIDEKLGHFMNRLGQEDVVLILSDHGAGPVRKTLYLNTWLKEKGFLASRKMWVQEKGGTETSLYPRRKRSSFLERMKQGFRKRRPVIDWDRTEAYFFDTGQLQGVSVNLKGREPRGRVEPDDYDRVRNRVIEELYAMVDEEEGRKVIEKVFRREEIYWGPYVKDAPDIVFVPNYEYMVSSRIRDSLFKRKRDGRGVHRLHGIFILRGPGIKKGRRIESAHIMDMAPTILYLLGVPVPKGFDGKVLTDALERDRLTTHPIQVEDPSLEVGASEFDMTEDEVEEMKKRLRGLQYID